LPEFTSLSLWGCKGSFFRYSRGWNVHTSVPILD
jgi:hypothetical protein